MASLTMEEYELMKDPKYRTYVSAVDKALKNFEYTSEWADLISALGKLNKVLLSYTKFLVIPRRIKISKRLAQCMHPALPSGVHLKALETYDIIFKSMGTNRLSQELFIYSAGLFPLLGHAAMNVRPSLLRVYESHFVPLGERLRPALSGFLSGVLLGLEEGSDHFDRTNSLLEKVCQEVGASYFYGCIWDCIASNSIIRFPAICFILTHFNKKLSMEDQLYIMGTSIDVLVNALCMCMQDTSVLVQRSALDLLQIGFPLHNSPLVRNDMIKFITAALSTVLRRDMSLNRRLFAWLLGTEINISLLNPDHPLVKDNATSESANDNLYFTLYSKDLLIQGIKIILHESSNDPSQHIKPYRLLISLLDKPDIGPVVLDDILYEVFRCLYISYHKQEPATKILFGSAPSKTNQELLKSANLFFTTLEPCYTWVYLGSLFLNACSNKCPHTLSDNSTVRPVGSGPPDLLEVCVLAEFLLDIVSLETYVDATNEHLPKLFLHIVTHLTRYCGVLSCKELTRSLHLCKKVMSRVHPATVPRESEVARKLEKSVNIVSEKYLEVSNNKSNLLSDTSYRLRANSDSSPRKKSSKSSMKPSSKTKKSLGSKFNVKQLGLGKNYKTHSISSPALPDLPSNTLTSPDKEMDGDLRKYSKSTTGDYKLSKSDVELNNKYNLLLDTECSKCDVKGGASFVNSCSSNISVPRKQSVLELCSKEYEKFYVNFINSLYILKTDSINTLFKTLLVKKPRETPEEKMDKLLVLLKNCMHRKETNYKANVPKIRVNGAEILSNGESQNSEPKINIKITDDFEEPMKLACSLLVELSTFPSYCISEVDQHFNDSELPKWLQTLLVCSCCLKDVPSLQLIAASTFLELISLLRTQDQKSSDYCDMQGVISVVIVPILKHDHLNFIENKMNVVQILAKSLWHHLGTLSLEHQVKCVELLLYLHNLLPSSSAVEDVIGESLMSKNVGEKIEAFQKFTTLWHVGREIESKMGLAKTVRTLDRSLLKILDNLQLHESCQLKLQAQSWLLHSLVHGDIPRLLDPILFMLLDPCTARMSVLHVSIEHSNTIITNAVSDTDEGATAAKIYAISSVDGNIIYHVSDPEDSKKGKSRTLNNPVKAKRIFAVTSLVNGRDKGNQYVTEKNNELKDIEVPIFHSIKQNQNISVFVNPLVFSGSSNNCSNDSGTEDESSIGNKNSNVSDFLQNATRFHANSDTVDSKKVAASDCDISPVDKEDFVCSPTGKLTKTNDVSEDTSLGNDSLSESSGYGIFEDNGLVKKWSASTEDVGELEVSTVAEDYFRSDKDMTTSIVQEILLDILDAVVAKSTKLETPGDEPSCKSSLYSSHQSNAGVGVHQFHSHMLLYCGVYDSNCTLYAFRTLLNVMLVNPRMFLCSAATTGITSLPRSSELITLLARHRKSVLGHNFHGELPTSGGEYGTAYRSSMYLEVLISVCLYFLRSYYPNLGQMRLTADEIAGNRQVQLTSTEMLTMICFELILIVRNSGKGFACYIVDLMSRCKLQKVVLHCVLSSVYNKRNTNEDNQLKVMEDSEQKTFTEEIITFNDAVMEASEASNKCPFRCSEHSEGFQIQLLRLLLSLIMLEHQVNLQKGGSDKHILSKAMSSSFTKNESHLRYIQDTVITEQPMFCSAVLYALSQVHMRHLHQHWTTLLASSLPFLGQSLCHIAISVINQLCSNIELTAKYYKSETKKRLETCCIPADYAVTQLEALTVLCHYCILESSQQQSHAFSQQLLAGSGTFHITVPTANPGQIFNNLVHVFTPLQQDVTSVKEKPSEYDPRFVAKNAVLSKLPRIIGAMSILWQALLGCDETDQCSCILGSPRIVRQQLLEFLSPIALHHGSSFIGAVSVAWQERRTPGITNQVVPTANSSQEILVCLLSAIKAMPIDTLVQTVHSVVKSPPNIEGVGTELLEVSALELFYCYMQSNCGPQLVESWNSLFNLLKDSLVLSPPAQFLSLAILNEFVQKSLPLSEKKDQKDLQDVTAKLVESCAQIAGSCLEQTTWLRRNLAVREEESTFIPLSPKDKDGRVLSNISLVHYSVQAQVVLSELLAPLLDVSYGSQEKERVINLLTSVMYNIIPYVKNHTPRNVASFRACSQLLANLSGYQYMRKAWRRDAFDLLLETAFFQMEPDCLSYWRVIVDNLMTHDTTTFRDLMGRVSLAQTGSLSIFSSREQEYEQRAQLLKRLAFVIFCSEVDQYHKYMPEIQERLAESLRLPQVVPSVQAQVFLCFRVLLLRMSPQHVTSLWPIIISEMVQVFLHIEQELSTDTDEFRRNNSSHIRVLSALDSSWVTNSNNGLHAHGHPHWLQLHLSAAKLLDLAVILPACRLPQFQMYRWAFVGDCEPSSKPITDSVLRQADFVPHVTRIARLMDGKFQKTMDMPLRQSGKLLITTNSIQKLQELHPFFTALSFHQLSGRISDGCNTYDIHDLEEVVERDFLDKLPVK